MSIKQISPEDARELLEAENSYVYLDVRSEPEFDQGRPQNSINIPIKRLNPSMGMLEDNPDFVNVVQANLTKDAKLIVGCAAGQRSMMACQVLLQNGYTNLSNVDSGFGGTRDMYGSVVKNGWLQLGYPIEQGESEQHSYETLKSKVSADVS